MSIATPFGSNLSRIRLLTAGPAVALLALIALTSCVTGTPVYSLSAAPQAGQETEIRNDRRLIYSWKSNSTAVLSAPAATVAAPAKLVFGVGVFNKSGQRHALSTANITIRTTGGETLAISAGQESKPGETVELAADRSPEPTGDEPGSVTPMQQATLASLKEGDLYERTVPPNASHSGTFSVTPPAIDPEAAEAAGALAIHVDFAGDTHRFDFAYRITRR